MKSRTAAELVPELTTLALVPGLPVWVEPTAIVAAEPGVPGSPGSPFAPFGIVKLKTAALDVPELVTDALVPGFPVVVVPTAIVAAAPGLPGVPGSPWSPLSPLGIVKLSTAAL